MLATSVPDPLSSSGNSLGVTLPPDHSCTQYRPPLRCYDPSHNHGIEAISHAPGSPYPQSVAFILDRIRAEPAERKNRHRHYTAERQDPYSEDNWRIAQQFSHQDCRLQLWKFINPNAWRVSGVTNPSWDDWISYHEMVEEAARMAAFCEANNYYYGGEIAVGHGKGYGVRLFCGTMDGLNLAGTASGQKRNLTERSIV